MPTKYLKTVLQVQIAVCALSDICIKKRLPPITFVTEFTTLREHRKRCTRRLPAFLKTAALEFLPPLKYKASLRGTCPSICGSCVVGEAVSARPCGPGVGRSACAASLPGRCCAGCPGGHSSVPANPRPRFSSARFGKGFSQMSTR